MSGDSCVVTSEIISIDRTIPFDPRDFLGVGWSIRGKQDENSLAMTKFDPRKIKLITTLGSNERLVNGETIRKRLIKSRYTCLDAWFLRFFLSNEHLIPESFKLLTNEEITHIRFDGTALADSEGFGASLCLYWDGMKWNWKAGWLYNNYRINDKSAVCEI